MANQQEAQLLSQLAKTLETSIGTLWKCAVIADQFTDTSAQNAFNDLVGDFVESLKEMDDLSRGITVKVPLRVVQYIHISKADGLTLCRKVDQGENPDLVTKEYFDLCRRKNDEIRGRLFATKVFEDSLRARLKLWEEQKPLQ